MARRDNGLPAASYTPLADVDPPLADHVLDVLRQAGIAAYAEPLAGETGPYRDVRPPDRPTSRVHVDRSEAGRARDLIGSTLPGLRADLLADAAARADRRDLDQGDVDAAWAQIVAGFGTVAPADPVPRWPVAEDVDADPDPEVDADAAPDGERAGGLAGRLVRRARPDADPDAGPSPSPDEPAALAADDPVDHYVPPHPPPLPRPRDTVQRFAWAGALGGPVVLVGSHLFGLEPWVGGLGVAAFVGGFVTLVARMTDRSDDGWDDGAVV